MFPVVFQLGPISIYSYGLMFAVAVIVCTLLMATDGRRLGMAEDFVYDLMFWLILSGVIGARLFFVVLNAEYFLDNPVEIIMLQHGGLAWQGGFIAAFIVLFIFAKRTKKPVLWLLDFVAPYAALGQAIGRIGCFLNGCCYGKHADWGIYCPVHADRLHPSQLYCSAGLVIVFFILKEYQKQQPAAGRVFCVYVLLAAALRFVVQFFRADAPPILGELTIFHLVSLGLFFCALVGFGYLARGKK